MPLAPSTRVGPYRIDAPLGAGGMGEVYKARDTKLDRDVALKILPEAFTNDAERLARFQREAKVLASLNHANIAAIYGLEETDDTRALVLELVEGPTLADRIAQGPIPVDEALPIAKQIAEALEAAHEQGIIHRDLKPANIKLRPDGTVKVLDFGLAKQARLSDSVDSTDEVTRAQLTIPGAIVGTVAYMSPEHLRGEPVDERTDTWAFGCLLYEMLAGRSAFAGRTSADIGAIVLTRDPDWTILPDSLPVSVVALIRQCLRKQVQERVQTMSDVRKEVADTLEHQATPATGLQESGQSRAGVPESRPRRRGAGGRSWMAYAAVATVLAVGLVTYPLVLREPPSAVRESSFRLANQFLATVAPGAHGAPTLSPDGSMMAFVSDESGVSRVWVQTLTEGAAPIPITREQAAALHPSWSPTNDQIVFHRPGDGIWTVGPLGTPAPRRIIEEGINPSFSWDGIQIVYERAAEVWIANADGSDQRAVEGADLLMPWAVVANPVVPGFPALSPDGASIVYFRTASGPMGDFWIVPAAGGEPRRLTFDTNLGSHPAWMPDGRSIVYSSMRSGSRTLWRIPVEGGEPEPVTTGAGEDSEPAVSRDGRRFVYSNVRNERAMMIYDPETGESHAILTRRYGLVSPRFSPDGQTIAFFGEVAGGADIYVVGVDGAGPRQVTRGDAQFNIHPRWSADGSTIYFYRDNPYREDAPGDFLEVSAAGGLGEVVFPDFYWGRHMYAEVHPEEDAVLYSDRALGGGRPVVKEIASGRERVLPTPAAWDTDLPFHLHFPRWSHDGAYLAASDAGSRWRPRDVAGGNQIWVCTTEGACESVVEGFWPVWSGDDTQLYFYRPGPAPSTREIWVADRDGGNARHVTEVGPLHLGWIFDVAPDGRIVWVQDLPGRPEIWSADIQ